MSSVSNDEAIRHVRQGVGSIAKDRNRTLVRGLVLGRVRAACAECDPRRCSLSLFRLGSRDEDPRL